MTAGTTVRENSKNKKPAFSSVKDQILPFQLGTTGSRRPYKVYKYAELRLTRPDLSKKECGLIAGYSTKTNVDNIEATKTYKDIRAQVERAAEQTGVTPVEVFATLKRSMDRSKEPFLGGNFDSTANQAAKIAGDFLGMQAPQQINSDINIRQSTLVGIINSIPVRQGGKV